MFDVVIPAVGKPALSSCLRSLVSALDCISSVILVARLSPIQVEEIASFTSVKLVSSPPGFFCKGAALNRGLCASTSELVLVSDADILWEKETLADMEEIARAGAICHVQEVEETSGTAELVREKYTPNMSRQGQKWRYSIVRDEGSVTRSGPGLVMAARQTWFAIGGYNEDLVGWGWEDHDLLVRARMCGYEVRSIGRVKHLSHGDSERSFHPLAAERIASRNRNILRSVESIQRGRLLGSLSQHRASPSVDVDVVLPEEIH